VTGRRFFIIFLILLAQLLVPTPPAVADDVGLTSARLTELAVGGYVLEADVSPYLLPALRPPLVPERFNLIGKPSYRRVGVGLVVRYEFGGSDEPLGPGDTLLLPWGRSAVLLTARWADGEVRRGMFPRGVAGIRVPIEALRPMERTAAEVTRSHAADGLAHGSSILLRLLLVIAFIAAAGWGGLRLAFVFAAGLGLSMVAVDLDVPTLTPAFAAAALGFGAALTARSAVRGDGARLWPLALTLGCVDGLGLAGGLAGRGLASGELVPALFGAAAGAAGLVAASALVLAWTWKFRLSPRLWTGAAAVTGCIAVAAAMAVTGSGLKVAANPAVDPAEQLAAARFEFRSGGSAGGMGGGGRRTAPPQRLDDAALIFLTVEPKEVRVEVLLGLIDFIGPLRIEGGPGSVVPVEVQEEIAARAKEMVAETMTVIIDGRDAVPLLKRTDFVTVAATGVSTRTKAERELLDTAVLGVTLVYGAERPPGEIDLAWQVFPFDDTAIPAVWTDPTGSEKGLLTAAEPVLHWSNDLSSYAPPPVRAVPVKAPRWPVVSLLLAALAALLPVIPRGSRQMRRVAASTALALSIFAYPFVRTAVALPGATGWTPSKAEAAEVADDLLTNVYRSFDMREESAIYDRLNLAVTGGKLEEIYLENRRALELENRGGARARVDEVEVLEVPSVRPMDDGGFRIETTWTVSGSVNHFGHVHYRQNRYEAALHIADIEGTWKITAIELMDEKRLL
jgi:hypothetical protein